MFVCDLVTEDEILDIEREAFVSLCGEPKSQERMPVPVGTRCRMYRPGR